MKRDAPRLNPFALMFWAISPRADEMLILVPSLLGVCLGELSIPFLLGRTVDAAVSGRAAAAFVVETGAIVLCVAAALYVAHAAYLRAETMVVARATLRLRQCMYARILDQPLSYFGRQQGGELAHRVMIDADVIDKHGIYLVADFPFAVLTAIGVLCVMIATQPVLACLITIVLAASAVFSHLVGQPLGAMQKTSMDRWSRLADTLQQVIAGIRTIKSFGHERHESIRIDRASAQLAEADVATGKTIARLEPLLELIKTLGFLATVWFGAWFVMNGSLSPGRLVAFIAYMELMSEPLEGAGRYVRHFQQAKGSLARICEFLAELAPRVVGGSGAIQGPLTVELKGICFCHPGGGRPVLKEVSFAAEPGEIIAIVGPNGAGKSTLLDILMGLRSPDKGTICVGGLPLAEWDAGAWRRATAAVPQELFLFHATLDENIRYGAPDATDDDVRTAAVGAGLGPTVARLPLGLRTFVGREGGDLSGGERQSVALARALVRKPRIVFLDEPTSALDGSAMKTINRTLREERQRRVTFVVTHDSDTIANADRVVVLEQGRIAHIGRVEAARYSRLLAKSAQLATCEMPGGNEGCSANSSSFASVAERGNLDQRAGLTA